ncbi:APC family permease [Kribbella jiaozuonensis]|uniref:Amino acid permease n=1 Tax=Kribbella jiaozuonensis TaxID=2575441 RepID=A0A4U3LJW5_9ACTN|nr:APC family permease [Kribbella jiaozuonensis]TKK74447.1 amino acid permease [Kribbella jiaozuonensis]
MSASQPEHAKQPDEPRLARRLGLGDAVVIGLGSMVGAGVFAVWSPAAHAAGSWLLLGLGIAAVVAYCNAASSAQLAAVYPVSGGTYVYGRERLGEWWGFAAGWCFVIGKTASCAAMALTFATYFVPDEWLQRLLALAAVLILAAVNYRGVTRTARLTRILVTCTLVVLALVLVLLFTGEPHHHTSTPTSAYGVLQSAGLLFFAFAGYARIATMGEEVREPAITIPRAITAAVIIAIGIYLLVAVALLRTGDPASTTAPLASAVDGVGAAWATPIVRIGAALASLGALLALIAGVGRTTLAMARNQDLPAWLAAVHPRYQVPHHAELALAAVVGVLVLTTDLRGVIGFSSFGVLLYYAIANASAFTQPADQRRWPRAVNVIGLIGCVILAVTLPWTSAVVAAALLAAALLVRRFRTGRAGSARS